MMTSGNGMENGIEMVTGLGNPGAEYAGTRHNLGFDVVARLLEKLPRGMESAHGCGSAYWHGRYAGRRLFLQTPLTYMNLSGNAVSALARANGIGPSGILVIHDDMDLPVGRMRIRSGGGDAGHNGIKSIVESLGTESFARLRIGIGRKARGSGMADYVLSSVTEDERTILEKVADAAADAVILILRRGLSFASTRYNGVDYAAEPDGEQQDTEEANKKSKSDVTT